jgi:hypothetical protein
MKTKLSESQKNWAANMPNNKSLKIFLSERFSVNRDKAGATIYTAKDIKITNRKKDIIFFEVDIAKVGYIFSSSFAQIQYINKDIVHFYIKNDLHGFGSIVSEVDFFRKYPESAEKRKLTVI